VSAQCVSGGFLRIWPLHVTIRSLNKKTARYIPCNWTCFDHAHSSSPPPSGSRRSGSWSVPTTNYSCTLSYSLNVLLLCNTSFWSHDVYSSVHPGEGSSSVALLKVSSLFFSLWSFFSPIFWEFFLIRCERSKVRDVVCGQIVKPSEANLYFVITGCTKWTELNWISFPAK